MSSEIETSLKLVSAICYMTFLHLTFSPRRYQVANGGDVLCQPWSPTWSIVPTKLSPITTPLPPLMAGYWYSHSPHIALILLTYTHFVHYIALISLTYTRSVQCALIQLLRTIVPKPLWLAAAADREGGRHKQQQREGRDNVTWHNCVNLTGAAQTVAGK